MKRTIQILALFVFASISIFAQEVIDQKMVSEKYDEVSRLGTTAERREFFSKQSWEMRTALWHENIDRKTKEITLSAEQKEIIDVVRKKFITVKFAKAAMGTDEADAGQEYKEIMGRAKQLLGKEIMRDLFGILGDSKTLQK
jgi:hypothetical protein